jgi:threonyl-tRNA synthetase
VQAVVIPITDAHVDYAHQVARDLATDGVRAEVDERNERMNLKIRDAQLQKMPYMVIVGNEEMTSSTVSVRLRGGGNLKGLSVADFKSTVQSAVSSNETV